MRGYHPHLVRGEFIQTDDSADDGFQLVDLYGLDGETLKQVYRPQPYGLSTHAPKKSNGMFVSFGGERSLSMLIGGDLPGKRPHKLNEGDAVLYDQTGNVVSMVQKNGISVNAANGDIVAKSAQGKVTITSKGHTYVDPGSSNVYLGMSSVGGAKVMTESGPSKNVYAAV